MSPAERVPPPPPSQRGTPGEILPAPGAPGVQSPEGAQSESAPRSPGDSANRTPKTTRQKLFDSDVIAKLTEPSKQSEKKESGITFDTTEFKYYGYLQRLKEKIQGIWRYPPDAADRGIYGDLYIRFTIKKNGRLGAVELVRTSGYRSLDDAAIKALWDGDPYWPLPDEWGRDGFTITGHFVYTLHGMHVR